MPSNTAQFYVKDANGNLVPAKFLSGCDGNYVVNPNTTQNTVNSYDNQYFNSDGSLITNANQSNYIVVPVNYSVNTAI